MGYRGEVMFKFKTTIRTVTNLFDVARDRNDEKLNVLNGFGNSYEIGDRIGQLIILPYPTIEFEESDELSETERGSGSYGSTGK